MNFVYSILNKSNGKIYVGQTTQGANRFSQHKSSLRRNKHQNHHLQSSWNKYGEESFEFNVLEYCEEDKLGENEEWWINYFESLNPLKGYNLKEGGTSNFKFSRESRNKMSLAHIGKSHTTSTKYKMSTSHKGRKLTDSHRKNISNSKKGDKNPMFMKKGKLNPNYGKCREESPVWKNYPRIVKNGIRNGKQRYSIVFDKQIIKSSISVEKLEEHLKKMVNDNGTGSD